MKHYWINIEKSTDRREFMHRQFEANNLEHYRVPAITPAEFDKVLAHKRPLTCKYPGCNTCEYEFACICSHIKAMQMGLEGGDEYFMILEDDIYLPFKVDYENLLKDIPKDTEILQMLILYAGTVINLYNHYVTTGNRFIKWKYLLPSAGFYMVSRKGAQKLVDMFYNKETQQYDFSSSPYQIVADVLLYETAISYAINLPYAYPYVKLGSEIHPDHIPAHENAIVGIKRVLEEHDRRAFPYVLEKSKFDPNS